MSNITKDGHLYDYMLNKGFMHHNNVSCISLTSHYIFKMAAVTGCYDNFVY